MRCIRRLVLVVVLTAVAVAAADPDLLSSFAAPPSRYGPSCFWWWFGAPYSAKDVVKSLDALKDAGLGGFRIYPVYAFPGAKLPPGVRNAPYLSPEFVALERTAVEHGRAIGLTPEAFLTSGWPYGGPWITPELGAGQLKFYSREVRGPVRIGEHVPGEWKPPERLLAVQAAELSGDGVDLSTTRDVTAQVSANDAIEWEVPAGRWLLMTFVSGYTGMKVKRAAPGGEGLVLDPFNPAALDAHLKAAGDRQTPALSGALAIGIDSWEVYNSNWTAKLPVEFERRRGYSLIPYLPALFLPAGDTGARVRYDYWRTLSDLAIESFFSPVAAWAHSRDLKLRSQAHGTPADVIEAYGAADFPEGETYGPEDRNALNIRDRKFASSAAHLFGRRQVSAESFTWLRFPMFRVTLEEMKAAADAIYLDGVNQVNFHGVPFSPAWAEPPGFYFYASTFVSPGNTWWPYIGNLTAYLRRANFVLQQGDPVADVAVYAPYEDVWSHALGTWSDLAGSIEKRLHDDGSAGMLRSLREAGYDFDFINAQRLASARIDAGTLAVGVMRYRVILLPSLETIEPDALERIRDFCRSGGFVIAAGRVPSRAPGLGSAAARNARVVATARDLFGSAASPWRGNRLVRGRQVGRGYALVVDPDPARNLTPPQNAAVTAVSTVLPPDFKLDQPDTEIGFVHRRSPGRDVYFVANIGPRAKTIRACLRAPAASATILDPATGRARPGSAFPAAGGCARVSLALDPWDSAFVVLGPSPGTNTNAVADSNTTAIMPINGPWTLLRAGVQPVTLTQLQSWTQLTAWSDFSGTATYSTTFTVPGSFTGTGMTAVLDLGEVQDVAAVAINGKSVGVAWKHPFVVDISGALQPGANRIEVRVTNTLVNGMLAHEQVLPSPYYKLSDYIQAPEPSGLRGPVTLRLTAHSKR